MKVYRILLVEDDSQIVAGLSEYLQAEGFIVDRAAGQRQALRKMEEMCIRDRDSHLGDFIPDTEMMIPADAAAFTLLKEQLLEVLGTLTDREQKVLRLRFGLDDGRARTLEEVGKEFQVTRERIRQIEAKALRKLRHPSRSKKLRDYLE